ncbi:Nicotinate-nucleotide--dimethylbenzimidazole phosphoribosyltransferase [Atlantibacter hermannii]|nr:Nicotinate-nucleotide--dimethylbenzimidazole phosphoribosyltransferase [Atlantibacter hermannii]
MDTLASLICDIPPLNAAAMRDAQTHLDGLLKPPGSLGRLESLAVQLAGMPGLKGMDQDFKKAIIVMCADHGVYDEQVTLSPKAVTAIQTMNMLRNNTGVCVLAKQAGALVHVIDIGIDSDPLPGILSLKVARGSGNIAREPAMSGAVANALLARVISHTSELAQQGVKVFGVGELGMANTTPAAAMISVLAGAEPAEVVGAGANFPQDKMAHKIAVVQQAIAVNQPDARDGGRRTGESRRLRSAGHDGRDPGRSPLRFAGGPGRLSFLCVRPRSLQDRSGGETLSYPFAFFC